MICVLVVDRDDVFTRSARRSLERFGHRVLTARTVAEAAVCLRREAVDLIVLDPSLPEQPVETLSDLLPDDHATRIVAVTGAENVPRLKRLGVQGLPVLVKPLPPDFLPLLASAVDESEPVDRYAEDMHLSARETEILQATVRGQSEEEIVTTTGLAVGTIRSYWQRIFHKTGCHSKTEVTAAVARSARRVVKPEQSGSRNSLTAPG